MRRVPRLTSLACTLGFLTLSNAAHAVTPGVIDTFGSEHGWEGGEMAIVSAGGPLGAHDSHLSIVSDGGSGVGSRLAAYNRKPDWIGDFKTAGITSLDMDMVNYPASAQDLSMRLVLFGPNNTNNRWTSKQSIKVPRDGQWHHLSFPISPETIQRVAGTATYDAMLSNVVRVLFRHDNDPAGATGTPVAARVGVDNITLVGPKLKPSDFNRDGVLDVNDINLLLTEVKAGTNTKLYDRTGDGLVNVADIVKTVTSVDDFFTYIGDSNLDGEFNTSDLVVLFQAGQYEDAAVGNSKWETGDWNGDAEFNSGDLLFAFQQGGFEEGPRVTILPVPEPSAAVLTLVGMGVLAARARDGRRRPV